MPVVESDAARTTKAFWRDRRFPLLVDTGMRLVVTVGVVAVVRVVLGRGLEQMWQVAGILVAAAVGLLIARQLFGVRITVGADGLFVEEGHRKSFIPIVDVLGIVHDDNTVTLMARGRSPLILQARQ